ncbi:MAG: tetratricopeptide repeat protein [Leeuwenhoekiella sp.]
MKVLWVYLVFIAWTSVLIAQEPIENGFKLLEAGAFEKAASFFEGYLEENPDNVTAQICYGRALGLSGNAEEAVLWFDKMLRADADNLEIRLNAAESLLWASQFEQAEKVYEKLVATYPDNFTAVLGYANTLSNLKKYDKATKVINQALAIDPGNPNAMVSLKYIRLGKAYACAQNQDYDCSKKLLRKVLAENPKDKDGLLNLADVYIRGKELDSARVVYKRYAVSPTDSITALNGLSLLAHLDENNKEALHIARHSTEQALTIADSSYWELAQERYIQALIWNKKFSLAKEEIAAFEPLVSDKKKVYALSATLGMYTGNFKESLNLYEAILKLDSLSFDGNLGGANALFAYGKKMDAYDAAFKTLDIYDGQLDAVNLVEKLNLSLAPELYQSFAYTADNGDNVAFGTTTAATIPWSSKFRTTVSYGYRQTQNNTTDVEASTHALTASMLYNVTPVLDLSALVGANTSKFMDESYIQPLVNLTASVKPFARAFIAGSYSREVQNFNADLIGRELVLNHYGINYNLTSLSNLGWYTQAMYSKQSDGNTRQLLFTSVYYQFKMKPLLKTGVNYQYVSFTEQRPTIYFSPGNYYALEGFAEFKTALAEGLDFGVSGAGGFQNIDNTGSTSLFRAESQISYSMGKQLSAKLYGKYSNAASATAAGFEFTEVGIGFNWIISKKPIFYSKIVK